MTEDLRAIQRELNCAAMQAPGDPELMEALSQLPEIESLEVLKSALDQMRHFLWFYVQVMTSGAEAEDRPLLLVVDGLDEDLRPPGLTSVAAQLPQGADGRVHVLVSSRTHVELRRDLRPWHPLAKTEPVTIRPFEGGDELADLALQEIAGLIRRAQHLAIHLLGLLAAAAGPLAVSDLIRLSRSLDASSPSRPSGPKSKR